MGVIFVDPLEEFVRMQLIFDRLFSTHVRTLTIDFSVGLGPNPWQSVQELARDVDDTQLTIKHFGRPDRTAYYTLRALNSPNKCPECMGDMKVPPEGFTWDLSRGSNPDLHMTPEHLKLVLGRMKPTEDEHRGWCQGVRCFDLSNHPGLCAEIPRQERNTVRRLFHSMRDQHQKLATQEFSNSVETWTKFCLALRRTQITNLNLESTGLGPMATSTLSKLLSEKNKAGRTAFGQGLRELNIAQNPLGKDGLAQLGKALEMDSAAKGLECLIVTMGDQSKQDDSDSKLSCTVFACDKLTKQQDFTNMGDIYVEVTVADVSKRTSVKRVKGGNNTVSWASQRSAGETLSWNLDSRAESSVSIAVMDKDSMSKDDLIGRCSMPVNRSVEAVWVELDSGGRVHVLLRQTRIGPTELVKA
eukprot:COSAG01_NODE_9408_length_2454_cov_1.415287_2_plen_415_part_00